MRAHNPKLLAEAILFVLYKEAIEGGSKISQDNILSRLPSDGATNTLMKFAIDGLKQRNFLENSYGRTNEEYFIISEDGYNYVRYRLPLTGSAINSFSNLPEWLLKEESPYDDAPEIERATNPGAIPVNIGDVTDDLADIVGLYEEIDEDSTENDNWEPLPLDYESPKIEEALVSVEEVSEAVRQDNGFSATHAEERDNVLWALGAGVLAIRERHISKDQFQKLLIDPMNRLIKRFKEAAITELAKTAVAKLMGLIF